MSKAKEYQTSYEECFKIYDDSPESKISSLSYLIEDMIQTIRELEEYQKKKLDLECEDMFLGLEE